MKSIVLSIILICMSLFSMFGKDNNKTVLPDFNFPQDVIKDSEAQLKSALSKGDGISVVDALIKFSLAKSSLSDETFCEVIEKIDTVIANEKKEDIKAILLLLESDIYRSHEDSEEADSVYQLAIANEAYLRSCLIESYPGIINSDDLGRRLCPTLYDFLRYKRSGTDYIYSILDDGEMQGFKLKDLPENKDNYQSFIDYIEKYPDGVWANDIRNKIAYTEKQDAYVSYSRQFHSSDSVIVNVRSQNAHDIVLRVYAFPANADLHKSYELKSMKLMHIHNVTFANEDKLFEDEQAVNIGKLPIGVYHIEVAVNGRLKKNVYAYGNQALKISDTSYFIVDHADLDSTLKIFVDTKSGAFVRQEYEEKRYFQKPEYNPQEQIQLLTDLAIYRPNETINYTVLCCEVGIYGKKALADRLFKITLYNNKGKEMTADTLTTDRFGQLKGSMTVPADETNGEFRIEAKDITNNRQGAMSIRYVSVSEYKTPTFYIDLSDNPLCFDKDKEVVLKGRCVTYSGIAIANREVRLDIVGNIWLWRMIDNDILYSKSLTAVTDANGEFSVSLDPKALGTAYRRYSLSASVTDGAGETQSAQCYFFIGQMRSIEFTGNDDIAIDEPIFLPLSVSSSEGEVTDALVSYSIAPADNPEMIVSQGKVNPMNDSIDLCELKSGSYVIKAKLDDCEDVVEHNVVLYHKSDTTCPVLSPLWLPSDVSYVDPNGKLHATIGTAFDSHIYYVATCRTGVISQGWIDYRPGIHEFCVQIPEGDDQHINVQLKCYYDGKLYSEDIYHTYQPSQKRLNLQIETFRNKITPGSKEIWKFRVTDNKGKAVGGRLALEVISEAIDNIRHNSWEYLTPLLSVRNSYFNAEYIGIGRSNSYFIGTTFNSTHFQIPQLNLYGHDFLWGTQPIIAYGVSKSSGRLRSLNSAPMMSMAMSKNAQMDDEDIVEADVEESVEIDDASATTSDSHMTNIRVGDVKVAMWQPMIDVADDGSVTVEFDVPSDNTTWKLQMFAFGEDHSTSTTLTRSIIAQRTLMVKPSLPRFLRSGDKTKLMTNVLNSSDSDVLGEVTIELFDPRSGKVLTDTTMQVNIPASGMTAVGISAEACDNLSFLGFRVKAAANGSVDGEQQMIPVLPSVAPVIETIPFYLNPTDGDTLINIDHFPADAKISFEYCNNPVWYCLQTLPTIYDAESKTATGLIHNLYAVSLSKGLSENNPMIANALRKNITDNEDSKEKSLTIIKGDAKAIIKQLCSLQNPDGGLSWFDWQERESSEYVTYQVLELLGELRQLGFGIADPDLCALEQKALAYYEARQMERLDEMKKRAKKSKNDIDYCLFNSYLYLRTLFPADSFALASDNAQLLNRTLKYVEKHWRNLSLPSRGFTALSLYRNKRVESARLIIESLRQFAINDTRRGMFWDNLQTFGFRWYNRTALTALMLEAFHEVDPRQTELDNIRKWMLLEKQTTDWGSSSMASEATYAILSTGSQWLHSSECEYFKHEITSRQPITVHHLQGAPAWGAVYAQFPTKVSETKAFRLPEIEIKKELKKYEGNKVVNIDQLHVGDKVQVVLTVNTDRDMQYVTINDHRAACFEPADKFSGYQFSDSNIKHRQSIGYYNDIKDTQNRILINFLPKGSHVISYDIYVTNSGTFCTGIAEVTCEYAPQFTAHTQGEVFIVGH